jgi:DNA replication protein DnaC
MIRRNERSPSPEYAAGSKFHRITSNRAVEEWVALFDDPILANSALDRFAHRAHQIVMEGPSLRAPRTLRSPKGRRPGEKPDSGG